jgi:hypothetical protein
LIADPLFPVAAADVALTNDEWYTPRWLFEAAGITFDTDVCAPLNPEHRTCPAHRYLTAVDDGLSAPWDGLVWCNPPYSQTPRWVDRIVGHRDWLMLTPVMREQAWRRPLMGTAEGVALVDVRFHRPDGSITAHPYVSLLSARGEGVRGLAAVARAAPYTGGAWFMRQADQKIPLEDEAA